jgi:hypothetical protein
MANPNEHEAIQIEPEALRAAEFMQAQAVLEAMVGRKVVAARVEDTRIAIETDDGKAYFFYGFMGEDDGSSAT